MAVLETLEGGGGGTVRGSSGSSSPNSSTIGLVFFLSSFPSLSFLQPRILSHWVIVLFDGLPLALPSRSDTMRFQGPGELQEEVVVLPVLPLPLPLLQGVVVVVVVVLLWLFSIYGSPNWCFFRLLLT